VTRLALRLHAVRTGMDDANLFETRRQGQRQHLSLPRGGNKLGTCGTQLSFSSKSPRSRLTAVM